MPDLADRAKRWRSTAAVFRQLAKSIRPNDWRPTIPAMGTDFPDEDQRDAARQVILATYPPVLQECLDVIRGWLAEREHKLPDRISQEARYWIYHMALGIADFCGAHVCQSPKGSTTILPYPEEEPIEVCNWMIEEWWSNNGLRKFVAQATTDQTCFIQKTSESE
jgi:hypothetical protein